MNRVIIENGTDVKTNHKIIENGTDIFNTKSD